MIKCYTYINHWQVHLKFKIYKFLSIKQQYNKIYNYIYNKQGCANLHVGFGCRVENLPYMQGVGSKTYPTHSGQMCRVPKPYPTCRVGQGLPNFRNSTEPSTWRIAMFTSLENPGEQNNAFLCIFFKCRVVGQGRDFVQGFSVGFKTLPYIVRYCRVGNFWPEPFVGQGMVQNHTCRVQGRVCMICRYVHPW